MAAIQHTNPWGKLLVFVFAVLLPAIIIATSTYYALYDSFPIILGLLLVSVGVAAILNYYSGDATPRVRWYCIITHVLLAAVMSFGLVLHILLSRDISMAKQNVAEVEHTEDRRMKQLKEQQDKAAELLRAQSDLEKARAQSLKQEAIRNDSARRLGVTPRAVPQSAPPSIPLLSARLPEAPAMEGPMLGAVVETPQVIRQRYSGWLIASAILDVIFSILAAVVLVARWEWDRDHDGVNDKLQGSQSPKA